MAGVTTATVDEALRDAASLLRPRSSTPRLDAEVILAHVLNTTRASLLARFNDSLTDDVVPLYRALIDRRRHGEPVAYITGHREFYGLDLEITPDVLVPRPETESLVEVCLKLLPRGEISHLADVGTGSGAIALAVAAGNPTVRVYATEVSIAALAVARRNAARLNLHDRVTFLDGDLLAPVPHAVDVIAANLPYVPPGEAEPDVALWEPRDAVFGGGQDGTATILRFLTQAPEYLRPGGSVVMETAHSQGRAVSEAARKAFPGAVVDVKKDLSGYDRLVVVRTA
ncbi:MAG TPA: peptide chain release factor N(5)-glutamine methyltransferase [Chloroflexia bacterium]|nr:peptide chain release factor N(5)-glutamine methyltransferase [Chloroflexia bacterium]